MRFLARATIFGFRLAPLLLLVYWILIFTGTHLPGSELGSLPFKDKVLHFTAFAGLAFLLAWALPPRIGGGFPGVAVAAAVALAYGVFDEWSQQFVFRRTPSLGDLLADALGILFGLLAYLAIRAVLFGVLARPGSPKRDWSQAPHR